MRKELQRLPDEYLMCRDTRHAWSQWTVWSTYDRGRKVYKRVLICERCRTERVDTFQARDFKRVSTNYYYNDDYMIRGDTRVAIEDVRRESFRRVKGEIEHGQPN